MLIIALVGSMKVTKGLDLTDMVAKGTTEYDYFAVRQKYFSYYNVYVVVANQTDGSRFDYANNQQLLYDIHEQFSKVMLLFYTYALGKEQTQYKHTYDVVRMAATLYLYYIFTSSCIRNDPFSSKHNA